MNRFLAIIRKLYLEKYPIERNYLEVIREY